MPSRRTFLRNAAGSAVVGGALVGQAWHGLVGAQERPLPIVFVHGNGDTAGLWITTLWRFESHGYPSDLLHAVDLRYPQARSNNEVAQPGRSSADDVMRQLAVEVADVRKRTGAAKVILVANSRGGNTVRNYIKNGGGADTTAIAILCGATNHGVIVSDKALVGSEFNGTSAFLRDLNSTPGEVVAGVRFVTIRSAENDKFAQPDGRHLGMPGVATGIGFDAPELKGAENIVVARIDHRETAFGPDAFAAMFKVITGRESKRNSDQVANSGALRLNGKISGFEAGAPTNIGLAGGRVTVFAIDGQSGERLGTALHTRTTGADGAWGPLDMTQPRPLEIVVEAPGYPITHVYRSAFPRASDLVHIRPQVLAKDDDQAGSVVYLSRPRGYFGAGRDTIELDGKPAPGIPEGVPTVSTSKLRMPEGPQRPIVGRFNAESITARTWPLKENRVTVIELTW